MKALLVVCAFAFTFVVTAHRNPNGEDAETFGESQPSSSYRYKRSNDGCAKISSNQVNNCNGPYSPKTILEKRKKDANVENLSGEQKKELLEVEEFDNFMIVAQFYVTTIPLQTFELTAFDKALPFPFASLVIRRIVGFEHRPAPRPTWVTTFDFVKNFNQTSNQIFQNVRRKQIVDDYSSALFSLQQLLQSPSSDSELTESDKALRRSNFANFATSCNNFKSNIDTFGHFFDYVNEQTPADFKFEREKLIEVIRATLSFMIGTTLIQEACSNDASFKAKFITKDLWSSLIKKMNEIDQLLMDTWQDQFENRDLDNYDYNSKKDEEIVDELKERLNKKYYWNTFDVIVDSENGKKNIVDFKVNPILRDPSKMKPDKITGVTYWEVGNAKSNNAKPVYVAWSTFKQNEEYNPIVTDDATDAIKPGLETTAKVSTDGYAKAAAFSTLVQATGEAFKRLGKNADGLNQFKNLLKSFGAFAKNAGPIASAICSILSAYYEDGIANIMTELTKGFKEMHQCFDKIDEKLDKIEGVIKLENAKQSYEEQISNRLVAMKLTMNNHLTRPCAQTPLEHAECVCTDANNNPHQLINWIEKYFGSSDGSGQQSFDDLGQQLFDAVDYDINKLRKNFLRIAGDASDLERFYLTMCLPVLGDDSAYKVLTSTKNAHWLRNIINEASRLDNRILVEWPTRMEAEVFDVIKTKPTDSTDQQQLAQEIYEELIKKYWWNEFHVVVFKNTNTNVANIRQRRLIHPSYGRHVRVTGWDVVINWRVKEDGNDKESSDQLNAAANKIRNALTGAVKESHCKTGVILDFLTSKPVQDANVKTIFIRKDLEKITYNIIPSYYNLDNSGQWPPEDKSVIYLEHSCHESETDGEGMTSTFWFYKIKYIFNLGDI